MELLSPVDVDNDVFLACQRLQTNTWNIMGFTRDRLYGKLLVFMPVVLEAEK